MVISKHAQNPYLDAIDFYLTAIHRQSGQLETTTILINKMLQICSNALAAFTLIFYSFMPIRCQAILTETRHCICYMLPLLLSSCSLWVV